MAVGYFLFGYFSATFPIFLFCCPIAVSRPQVSAPPGFSAPNRLPPPGFSSHERVGLSSDTTLGIFSSSICGIIEYG